MKQQNSVKFNNPDISLVQAVFYICNIFTDISHIKEMLENAAVQESQIHSCRIAQPKQENQLITNLPYRL